MWRCLLIGACLAFPPVALSEPIDDICQVRPEHMQQADREEPTYRRLLGKDRTLAEWLDACNGVLKPPRIGDSEISEPPPDEGETPIIRPGEIPPQQSG